MSLKDKLISLLGGTPPVRPVDDGPFAVRSTTVPINSPQGQAIMAAMRSGNRLAMLDALRGTGVVPPAIEEKARAALGGDPEGDRVEWATWAKDAAILTAEAPDWTACRFFHRISSEEAAGAFGIVKGIFGIWRQPYDVCDYDNPDHESEELVLPALTYLPTGFDIGRFADTPTAVAAAEAARGLDWASMPPCDPDDRCRNAWRARLDLLKKTWAFHGMEIEERRHGHDPDGNMFGIIARRDPAAGKPEKVS